ncbi:unnamed protein product [Ceratitis capitata]|uniref:(Mediterranean fruit fly) hypothetical protein n=1 Tax=Ceratitis capitata TaxID=7213 RepID=A0A811U339_CERCA|nr:unnamed protein product [Ceratitis capitata]
MSPKVNSGLLHTCLKRRSLRTKQKLFATQNSKFCMTHTHLFDKCFSRNKESQPPQCHCNFIGHSPYSLDFFFFPYTKNILRGPHVSTSEEAVDAFGRYVLVDTPQSEWQKCFDNWFKRMQKCIDLNGECFEKQ